MAKIGRTLKCPTIWEFGASEQSVIAWIVQLPSSDDWLLNGVACKFVQHPRYSQKLRQWHTKENMDQQRIRDISVEMANLLEQQRRLLNDMKAIHTMPTEDLEGYAERNQRLRDLCRELTEV